MKNLLRTSLFAFAAVAAASSADAQMGEAYLTLGFAQVGNDIAFVGVASEMDGAAQINETVEVENDSAISYEAGAMFNAGMFDVGFSYKAMSTDGEEKRSSDSDVLIDALSSNGGGDDALVATIEEDLGAFDLNVAKTFDLEGIMVNVGTGIKHATIERSLDGRFSEGGYTVDEDEYYAEEQSSEFSGFGPKLAVGLKAPVAENSPFYVFGGAEVASLHGSLDVSSKTYESTDTDAYTETKSEFDAGVDYTAAEIGVGYKFAMGGDQAVDVKLGYETEKYSNAVASTLNDVDKGDYTAGTFFLSAAYQF
jgi:hypothetical protein